MLLRLLACTLLLLLIEARENRPERTPSWIRDKTPPPSSHHQPPSSPRRLLYSPRRHVARGAKTVASLHQGLFRSGYRQPSAAVFHARKKAGLAAKRIHGIHHRIPHAVRPVVHTRTSSSTLPPLRSVDRPWTDGPRLVYRSFERVARVNGKTRRSILKNEVLSKGKVIKTTYLGPRYFYAADPSPVRTTSHAVHIPTTIASTTTALPTTELTTTEAPTTTLSSMTSEDYDPFESRPQTVAPVFVDELVLTTTTTQPPPLFYSEHPGGYYRASAHRPPPSATEESPPSTTPSNRLVYRSFERISRVNGQTKRTALRKEILEKGKVKFFYKYDREGAERTKKRARAIARRNTVVSKDGSTVVTTSNSGSDEILVIMQDAAPGTTSVFSNADRKMKKVYEEALDDVTSIFVQMGSNLVSNHPQAANAFESAKKDLQKRMDGYKLEGAKTRDGAVKEGIRMAATTDDRTAETMKNELDEYLVYDSSVVMMDGLLYSMPVVYSIVQQAASPVQETVDKMHGAVENYVTDALSGLREKLPPLTKTTKEIENMMKAMFNGITENTKKKISGMMSYETLDAINDMDSDESQSVTVIQTGPGFSYVTFSSSAPSFSKSLNGTEERVKSAVKDYKSELEPFVNGKMLDPKIFGTLPTHEEKTKNINQLLDHLSKEVDEYLHNDHPKTSVEAAKAAQKNPEEKKKLNDAIQNSTIYEYVPMMYNGWYSFAPVAFTQATNLATATSNQLNSMKGEAVNYAYSLLMDIFGQYQLALVPIQQAVQNMTASGSNIESKLHETLPFAIAQATTEMPKDKKAALQQIVYYYVPSYPFLG